MATNPAFYRPSMIQASASSSRKSDTNNLKPVSSKWWSPLFGWSSDPDYINPRTDSAQKTPEKPGPKSESVKPRSKAALGCFTEEKAKQLRRKTMETATFHDIMYHSAIASRLASDVSGWPEK
ncbi:Xylanolytic transcriptional activator xlnR like [Quillaja saponaria]|uniref:Xylanolytic transcriptional activator xlnR like n=1 Tax=Quillaja saponaria TaxID=32244 RepID=A0AAD7LRA0_QUISA|nr:Xylanolytic transcriptional activator xlnR like [Quillaja saponaria]